MTSDMVVGEYRIAGYSYSENGLEDLRIEVFVLNEDGTVAFAIHALTNQKNLFIIVLSSGESVNPDNGFTLFCAHVDAEEISFQNMVMAAFRKSLLRASSRRPQKKRRKIE